MPEISRFLGIVIRMYYADHRHPHFHAVYGDYEIIVEIQSGIVRGCFPPRALRAVMEWTQLHKDELLDNWHRCRSKDVLRKIAPLE
jgi:hypothetical protein